MEKGKKNDKIEKKEATEGRAARKKMPHLVTMETNDIDLNMGPETVEAEKEAYVSPRFNIIEKSVIPPKKRKGKGDMPDIAQAQRFEIDADKGLTLAQVEQRISEGYVNATRKKTSKTYKSIFFSNICTFFNLLAITVAIALIIAGAGFSQIFFIFIISANIIIGIISEIRSKLTVDKLSLISAPSAVVVREGEKHPIPVHDVVLDDVMHLETGKQICADSIVIKGECEVNESMLTGESIPVKKQVGDMLYSGSFVSSGSAYVKAEKVGAANYVETLTSHAKKYKKPRSEVYNSVGLIIKVISILIVPISILGFYVWYNGSWQDTLTQVSGSIIGMIPAGMFLLTTIALSLSVIRLGKRKVLVQDIYCIEMLARVDVLCLDKTGTITDGTMQVNNVISIKGADINDDFSLSDIIGSMLTATEDNNQTAMALAQHFGYNTKMTPVKVLPFSSQRKLSAVTFENSGTYMLGAPEFVLRDMGIRIEKIIAENAANGFRVMVLAHSPAEIVGDKLPVVRRPLCLIVIEDHIREDAIETIGWFKENNVAIRVISGDNPMTVSEVAQRVGVERAELYISLDGLSNQEVMEAASKYTVFGRVTPEQKKLLIQAMKAKGHTVAMTGDGVNDILAMREADCSVAIASGAEAARNVSHLVLQDSNFTSMPDVVREGRRVVNNIQKSSSLFLMKTFMSIVLTLIFLILGFSTGAVYPFKTSNLLLLEMFVIAVPSFFLAMQPNKNIIRGKFLTNVISRCVPGGIALVVSVMAVYIYSKVFQMPEAPYNSMATLAMTFTGMMVLFKICEPFDAFRTVLCILAVGLCLVGIFVLPGQFGIVPLSFNELMFLAVVVLSSYFILTILMKIMSNIRFN